MTAGAELMVPEQELAPGASAENPFAGQGSVLLDIGGDVGALVVAMPASLISTEVEIRELGDGGALDEAHGHAHHHGHDHLHGHDHGPHRPHVAVVERTTAEGTRVPSLVFAELTAGTYGLSAKGSDHVELSVEIRGGQVTHAAWPA